jgi:Uma2 family endonuclease
MSTAIRSIGDLLRRVGNVSADRVRFHPTPGTATVDDVVRIQDAEGVLCELIDGVLVEKAMGYQESCLAVFLASLLNAFVIPRNLGIVTGADGTMQLFAGLVRIPDCAFVRWDRVPGGVMPQAPIPLLAPNLAAEVLSDSNTPSEMEKKRRDYIAAGVELVWEIDPVQRTVDVYTTPTTYTTLRDSEVLDGGTALPGFTLPLAELFGELDRHA